MRRNPGNTQSPLLVPNQPRTNGLSVPKFQQRSTDVCSGRHQHRLRVGDDSEERATTGSIGKAGRIIRQTVRDGVGQGKGGIEYVLVFA
jgi:hypothetical protein